MNNTIAKELGDYLFDILDQNFDSVSISDPNQEDNPVVYINKSFTRIFGYENKDILGKNCRILHAHDKEQKNLQLLRDAIFDQKPITTTIRNYTKDGRLIYVEITISPIFDRNTNKIKYFLGTQKDLTKSKEQEERLAEQSKMASMGEMIANIAHQWRQPLSVISTCATGLRIQKEYNTLSDEELYDACDMIDDNAQYLSQTIEDFRNFIKGDKKPVTFDLKNDTNTFLKLVDSTIKNTYIDVILDLQEHIKVNGYPHELIQCFINIFNNSRDVLKELPEEDRFLFITQKIVDNNIIITFQDSGGGIPEEIIDKIFEPYFTTKHKSQGTGLGLNMTYNFIVQSMNGTIDVKNSTFRCKVNDKNYTGALFTINIPLE
jgi:PAS domain S-box-containing protein